MSATGAQRVTTRRGCAERTGDRAASIARAAVSSPESDRACVSAVQAPFRGGGSGLEGPEEKDLLGEEAAELPNDQAEEEAGARRGEHGGWVGGDGEEGARDRGGVELGDEVRVGSEAGLDAVLELGGAVLESHRVDDGARGGRSVRRARDGRARGGRTGQEVLEEATEQAGLFGAAPEADLFAGEPA